MKVQDLLCVGENLSLNLPNRKVSARTIQHHFVVKVKGYLNFISSICLQQSIYYSSHRAGNGIHKCLLRSELVSFLLFLTITSLCGSIKNNRLWRKKIRFSR